MVLNASAFPLPHSDLLVLLCDISFIVARRLDSVFFSHVDVDGALQVINQILRVRLPPAHFNIFQSVYLTRLRVRLRVKKRKPTSGG